MTTGALTKVSEPRPIAKTDSPPPGVYHGVPFETYRAWKAVNHSSLKEIAKSPRHYRHMLAQPPRPPSPDQQFGTVAHAMMLEPSRSADLMVRAPINTKTGEPFGRATKAWAEYASLHAGKLIVTVEEIETLNRMAQNAMANPDVAVIMRADGVSEVSIVWDDPTGIRCKARIDRLITDPASYHDDPARSLAFVDIKTTANAALGAFRRDAEAYGYFTANAMYRRACAAHGYRGMGGIVALESGGECDAVWYDIDEETAKVADTMLDGWLRTLKTCRELNEWPGLPNQVLAPSKWWFDRFSNSIDE